jgi:hypothetical protein
MEAREGLGGPASQPVGHEGRLQCPFPSAEAHVLYCCDVYLWSAFQSLLRATPELFLSLCGQFDINVPEVIHLSSTEGVSGVQVA